VLDYVKEELLPALRERFADRLESGAAWTLEQRSERSPDLVFSYPTATDEGRGLGYVSQSILIEIGGRSDHVPSGLYAVMPYAYEHFPDYFSEPSCSVTVLEAERTFWEKATILHAQYHGGVERAQKARMARHYYDLYLLADSKPGDVALGDLDLLERVAAHKQVYFKAAWARYEEARPGSLRLVPPDDIAQVVASDYGDMQRAGYFYGDPPPAFDEILERLRTVEDRVNRGD
jgi:hypothetical protein